MSTNARSTRLSRSCAREKSDSTSSIAVCGTMACAGTCRMAARAGHIIAISPRKKPGSPVLLFHVPTHHRRHADRKSTAFAQRRFLTDDVVPARKDQQAMAGGLALDELVASVAMD